jgi:hypothetical protein
MTDRLYFALRSIEQLDIAGLFRLVAHEARKQGNLSLFKKAMQEARDSVKGARLSLKRHQSFTMGERS